MKIPSKLKQFEKDSSLIIVAGKQDAVLYQTEEGKIERIDRFKIPKPRYSDNEGVNQINDENLIKNFLKELKVRIRKASSFKKLYILAPTQTKKKIKSILPAAWRDKVRKTIEGNFYSLHPLDILKKIAINEKRPKIA